MTTLQFQSLSSAVEAVFWNDLGHRKIEEFKLDESAKPILGYYTTGTDAALPARLCVGTGAFEGSRKVPPFHFPAPGSLINTNTAEGFRDLDKKEALNAAALQVWSDITSGRAANEPWLLTRFLLLTFADLKKYKYKYWFSFVALSPAVPFSVHSITPIATSFTAEQQQELRVQYEQFRGLPDAQLADASNAGFFVVQVNNNSVQKVLKLADYATATGDVYFGFADASALSTNPGWHLRNFLVLLRVHFKLNRAKIIAYREQPGKNDISLSIVIDVDLSSSTDLTSDAPCPKGLGWEKNEQDKLQPRSVDLAPLMDPQRLAATSVDLNLKLMRWRLLPSLNLERIAATKCLLFGAGTLGCNVARALLGWGVRHITFIDNGKVSFSNPVRQSLFTFEDCLNGGKAKAPAAAEALKRIFPGITSAGYDMGVPMPGHHVTSEEQTSNDVKLIEKLIDEHDVVFLLMDTRESRWLPTLLCAAKNKLCINAALGFDTFVVMRHGIKQVPQEVDAGADHSHAALDLGCYFCNDVVAPTDSMSDRTLDQQCTVTRPGLSFVASALAVELMVALLQHPLRHAAPADIARSPADKIEHDMGLLPHQVRGYLTHYANMLVVGQSYSKCTACSNKVIHEYQKQGFAFLLRAFNEPTFIEDLTGLTELHEEAEKASAQWEGEDDDF